MINLKSSKTCPWVVNPDETKTVSLSYTDQNCVILYSTESNRLRRSTGNMKDHVTEMTFESNGSQYEVKGLGIVKWLPDKK